MRRVGRTRSFYVCTSSDPPREFYQLEDGLVVIRPAGPRPPLAPSKQQRWIPGTSVVDTVSWPAAWVDPSQQKTLREKVSAKTSNGAFRPRMPGSPLLTLLVLVVQAQPAVAAPGGDMASIVREAVATAMAHHGAAMGELQETVRILSMLETHTVQPEMDVEQKSNAAKRQLFVASSRIPRRPRESS